MLHDEGAAGEMDEPLAPRRRASITQVIGKGFRRLRNYVTSNPSLMRRGNRKNHHNSNISSTDNDDHSSSSPNHHRYEAEESGQFLSSASHTNTNDAVEMDARQYASAPPKQQQQRHVAKDNYNAFKHTGPDTYQHHEGDNQQQDDEQHTLDHHTEQAAEPPVGTRRRWRRSLGASLFDILGVHYNNDSLRGHGGASTVDGTAANNTTNTSALIHQALQRNNPQDNNYDDDDDASVQNHTTVRTFWRSTDNEQDDVEIRPAHAQYDDTTSDRFFVEEQQKPQQQEVSNHQQLDSVNEHPAQDHSDVSTVSYSGEEEHTGGLIYDDDDDNNDDDEQDDNENEQDQKQDSAHAGQDQPGDDEFDLNISLNNSLNDGNESLSSFGASGIKDNVQLATPVENESKLPPQSPQMLQAAGRVDLKLPQTMADFFRDDEASAAGGFQAAAPADNINYVVDEQFEYPVSRELHQHRDRLLSPRAGVEHATFDSESVDNNNMTSYEQLQHERDEQQQPIKNAKDENNFDNFEHNYSNALSSLSQQQQQQQQDVSSDLTENTQPSGEYSAELPPIADRFDLQVENVDLTDDVRGASGAATEAVANTNRTTLQQNVENAEANAARRVGQSLAEAVFIMESPEHRLSRMPTKPVYRERRPANFTTSANNNNNNNWSPPAGRPNVAGARHATSEPSAGDDAEGARHHLAKNFPNMTVQEFADSVPWSSGDEGEAAGGDIDSSSLAGTTAAAALNEQSTRQDNNNTAGTNGFTERR